MHAFTPGSMSILLLYTLQYTAVQRLITKMCMIPTISKVKNRHVTLTLLVYEKNNLGENKTKAFYGYLQDVQIWFLFVFCFFCICSVGAWATGGEEGRQKQSWIVDFFLSLHKRQDDTSPARTIRDESVRTDTGFDGDRQREEDFEVGLYNVLGYMVYF